MDKYFFFFCLFSGIILIAISISIYRYVNIEVYRKSFLNSVEKPLKIPKKIFQLIADKKNISPDFQKNIDFLQTINPDWQYTLYDDNDIIGYLNTYFPDKLKYYLRINSKYGAARADLFRYLLMYREGGVYLDIKSAITLPLSKVLLPDDEFILSYWDLPIKSKLLGNEMGEFQQWHIITVPEHPFLKNVIDKVLNNINTYSVQKFGVGKEGVLKVTGPVVYSNVIMEMMKSKNPPVYRIVELNDYIGLTYNNIQTNHETKFSKAHYSTINEPIIN